jgi:uncharacterized protein YdhG (YjbR/CyaY superfamily)
MKPAAENIDAFISDFPQDIQEKLQLIRETIRHAAPEAEECINYGIPTFKFHGNLVHFSAYKTHIGFYPGASGIAEFKQELSPYKTAKGTVQFALEKPLPLELISDIVIFRLDENMRKAKPVKKKK